MAATLLQWIWLQRGYLCSPIVRVVYGGWVLAYKLIRMPGSTENLANFAIWHLRASPNENTRFSSLSQTFRQVLFFTVVSTLVETFEIAKIHLWTTIYSFASHAKFFISFLPVSTTNKVQTVGTNVAYFYHFLNWNVYTDWLVEVARALSLQGVQQQRFATNLQQFIYMSDMQHAFETRQIQGYKNDQHMQ